MIRAGVRHAAALGAAAVVASAFFGAPQPIEAARAVDADCDGVSEHGHGRGAPLPTKRGRFETLPDVTLSSKVEDKLERLATVYQKRTGKQFVVTSGTRDPEDQADAIFDKLSLGDDILRLYRDKNAALELKRIYDAGQRASRPRAATVTELARAIRAQMRRGVFISAHLRAGAADVRSIDMTLVDKRVFVDAVSAVGGLRVIHETTPPHFHLQLE